MTWSSYTDDMLVAGIANRHSVINSINKRKALHVREIELRNEYLKDIRTMQAEQQRRSAIRQESAA